jgi:hypothetical protein
MITFSLGGNIQFKHWLISTVNCVMFLDAQLIRCWHMCEGIHLTYQAGTMRWTGLGCDRIGLLPKWFSQHTYVCNTRFAKICSRQIFLFYIIYSYSQHILKKNVIHEISCSDCHKPLFGWITNDCLGTAFIVLLVDDVTRPNMAYTEF